jgi:hypothetical protein
MRFAVICLVMVMGAAGMALTAVAQTNSLSQCTHWLILPSPHLRTGYAEPLTSRSETRDGQVRMGLSSAEMGPANLEIQRSDRFVASTDRGGGEAEQYYLRQPNFGFIPPARVSNDLVVRATDSIFRPEEFHIGRTATISCTISTAIQRRNPLCLLNRNFLIISF